jgi:DNA-binding LacI/PurR family transcriptional regulator
MRSVRLDDVARRAGVSTSTASRALNGIGELSDATRASVRQAAADLNYRPSPLARSLRTRRSQTVGLVVPTISHAFYGAVTHGAQAVLEAHGYRLILIDSGEEAALVSRALETLLDHQVDGLLVSTAPLTGRHFGELLGSTPCVFIDELAPGAGAGNVALENAAGISMLVEHLVEHGHRRIGFLGGPVDRTSGLERLEGFVAAAKTHGLPTGKDLVRECEWTIASGLGEATRLLSGEPRPTAVVTASGELALGALAAARGARLAIPSDLALACFDDLYFAPLLEPSLTSVAYDARSIGAEATRLLLRAIEDDEQEWCERRIDVRLVPRRSCGCEYDATSDLGEVAA